MWVNKPACRSKLHLFISLLLQVPNRLLVTAFAKVALHKFPELNNIVEAHTLFMNVSLSSSEISISVVFTDYIKITYELLLRHTMVEIRFIGSNALND